MIDYENIIDSSKQQRPLVVGQTSRHLLNYQFPKCGFDFGPGLEREKLFDLMHQSDLEPHIAQV